MGDKKDGSGSLIPHQSVEFSTCTFRTYLLFLSCLLNSSFCLFFYQLVSSSSISNYLPINGINQFFFTQDYIHSTTLISPPYVLTSFSTLFSKLLTKFFLSLSSIQLCLFIRLTTLFHPSSPTPAPPSFF